MTLGNNLTATLDLEIEGNAINSPFQTLGYGGGLGSGTVTCPVSGMFLIDVNALQTIQLRVTNPFIGAETEVDAISPSLTFLRVAGIP